MSAESANSAQQTSPHGKLHRAVFFDRDGVINVSPGPGYVLRWEDFRWMPGAIDTLRLCRRLGFLTILVTSQQGVGKGLMTAAELDRIHRSMQETLREETCEFTGIYVCPHLDGTCYCRKPSPKMAFDAASDHHIDLSRSILVGDAARDIEMARNAGIGSAVFFAAEHGPGSAGPDMTAGSHLELQRIIEGMV